MTNLNERMFCLTGGLNPRPSEMEERKATCDKQKYHAQNIQRERERERERETDRQTERVSERAKMGHPQAKRGFFI